METQTELSFRTMSERSIAEFIESNIGEFGEYEITADEILNKQPTFERFDHGFAVINNAGEYNVELWFLYVDPSHRNRPTNIDELTASIREAINNLEQFRDHPDTFTPEDHDYPEYALHQVMDDAGHAGYPSLVQTVPKRVGVHKALKILSRMLERCEHPEVVDTDWMNKRQAAEYLQMSESNLSKIVARSRKQEHPDIKFDQAKPKARIMFRREWLDDYLRREQVVLRSKPKRSNRRKQQPPEAPRSSHGLDPRLID